MPSRDPPARRAAEISGYERFARELFCRADVAAGGGDDGAVELYGVEEIVVGWSLGAEGSRRKEHKQRYTQDRDKVLHKLTTFCGRLPQPDTPSWRDWIGLRDMTKVTRASYTIFGGSAS